MKEPNKSHTSRAFACIVHNMQVRCPTKHFAPGKKAQARVIADKIAYFIQLLWLFPQICCVAHIEKSAMERE